MLNNIGLPGLLLIAVVVLVLFGRGKISGLMGEVGKGITAFKRGVDDGKREIEDASNEAVIEQPPLKASGQAPVSPAVDATIEPTVQPKANDLNEQKKSL